MTGFREEQGESESDLHATVVFSNAMLPYFELTCCTTALIPSGGWWQPEWLVMIVSPHLPPTNQVAKLLKAMASSDIFPTAPLASNPVFPFIRNSMQMWGWVKDWDLLGSVLWVFLVVMTVATQQLRTTELFLVAGPMQMKVWSGPREDCVIRKPIFNNLLSKLYDSQLSVSIWLKSSVTECYYSLLWNFTWPQIGF